MQNENSYMGMIIIPPVFWFIDFVLKKEIVLYINYMSIKKEAQSQSFEY